MAGGVVSAGDGEVGVAVEEWLDEPGELGGVGGQVDVGERDDGGLATLLAEPVSLRLSCLDRLLVQGYAPRLQSEGLLVRWMLDRGEAPSPRVFGRAQERMVDGVHRFVAAWGLPPIVAFRHGQKKEDIARPFQLAAAGTGREGVVLVGVAQEKLVGGWRGRRDGGNDAHPHFAFHAGPGVREPLLLLCVGPAVGSGVHQDVPVRSVPGVGVPERARVVEAPPDRHRDRVRRVGQRPAVL